MSPAADLHYISQALTTSHFRWLELPQHTFSRLLCCFFFLPVWLSGFILPFLICQAITSSKTHIKYPNFSETLPNLYPPVPEQICSIFFSHRFEFLENQELHGFHYCHLSTKQSTEASPELNYFSPTITSIANGNSLLQFMNNARII